MLHKNKNKMIK
ncbi:hypothetical protein MTR67_035107 [Solanum verrucosum]|uniref:Uncharacterized protein n=1 Tax=Solanum verrucosum TaxID=315347 RepID=A0AAF0U9B5_SOLVR|nr:hypothetical protein MTR67_035107 [Solanum verrucosum]